MKLSLLVSDLSSNALMRAYPFAKALEGNHEIEIIGPALRGEVYGPYRDSFSYKPVVFDHAWWKSGWKRRLGTLPKALVGCLRRISGDVVIAFKPRPSSLGVGLISQLVSRIPTVLDIDDLESDEFTQASARCRWSKALELGHPQNFLYTPVMELLARLACVRTANSNLLQRKFNAVKVYSGVDCDWLDPVEYKCNRSALMPGFERKKIVLFSGQVTRHKGVAELLAAVASLGSQHVKVVVAGPRNALLDSLIQEYPDILVYLGLLAHDRMPELLACADIVVLPQLDVAYAQAQVPGKLFEAMAMARPIVASAVSDLPEILSGCGLITPPGDTAAIAESIECILDEPELGVQLGAAARHKCQKLYSLDAIRPILESVLKKTTLR